VEIVDDSDKEGVGPDVGFTSSAVPPQYLSDHENDGNVGESDEEEAQPKKSRKTEKGKTRDAIKEYREGAFDGKDGRRRELEQDWLRLTCGISDQEPSRSQVTLIPFLSPSCLYSTRLRYSTTTSPPAVVTSQRASLKTGPLMSGNVQWRQPLRNQNYHVVEVSLPSRQRHSFLSPSCPKRGSRKSALSKRFNPHLTLCRS
jgi:hypothetical protein